MKKMILILLVGILLVSSFASAKTPEGKPFKEIWDAINEHDNSLKNIFVTKTVFNNAINSILQKIQNLQGQINNILAVDQKQNNNLTELENRIADLEERVAALENCTQGICGQQACIPSLEVCDNLDNDCDGAIDENLGVTTCGIGACQRTISNCIGGALQSCTPGTPSAEVCDGIDNDCDGSADENLGSTICGVGVCQRTVSNCISGTLQSCTPGTPSAEVCDGLDNDCDGQTDENLGSTTCGVGACQRTVSNCISGTLQLCIPGTPSAEVCDGLDNDCDGAVDENNICPPPNGTPCDDGNACTVSDTYIGGQCVGNPRDCNDGNQCTTDACDSNIGACIHTPVPDNTFCSNNGHCINGVCI